MSPGTETDPGSQTRPRSLRNKSTIIKFSARSFTRRSSASASATSAAHPNGARRRAVPLMGFASRTSWFSFFFSSSVTNAPEFASSRSTSLFRSTSRESRRKRSGEQQHTAMTSSAAYARRRFVSRE